jgi:FxsC-like protein
MADEASVGSDNRPYFFLSYPRSKYSRGDGTDPDLWIKEFFHDLCEDVYALTRAQVPGFMDADIPTGLEWSDQLAWALGACRVFVPVIDVGYCNSPWCGKEWGGFTQRVQSRVRNSRPPAAIMPVLWLPYARCVLLPVVKKLQLDISRFAASYREEGILGLIKLKKSAEYGHLYTGVVWQLAKRIVEAGQTTNLPQVPPIVFESAPNAFADHQHRDATGQIQVIMAVYHPLAKRKGSGRRSPARATGNHFYGPRMRAWTPYRDDTDATVLAVCAEGLVAGLGYRALLDPLDERKSGLRGAPSEPQTSPKVMLVDPWATGVPEIAKELREIDNEDPTHVVVPWNIKDTETVRREKPLTANLDKTLPNGLSLPGSAPRVHTLEEFRFDFPEAVGEAVKRYFRSAPSYPPGVPASMNRPSLRPGITYPGEGDA